MIAAMISGDLLIWRGVGPGKRYTSFSLYYYDFSGFKGFVGYLSGMRCHLGRSGQNRTVILLRWGFRPDKYPSTGLDTSI